MNRYVKPFLRWAGGKRWLAEILRPTVSKRLNESNVYFEPFLGSGAMFFSLQPPKAHLSDLNGDLINTFQQLAENPDKVIKYLLSLPATKDRYYQEREKKCRTALTQAVRFIYLNRNCYGGLYRENRQGIFNVPYGGNGRDHKGICRDNTLLNASLILKQKDVKLLNCDFAISMNKAKEGDVIYCDPTYRKVSRKHFDRYGKDIFSWEDQERLANTAIEAFDRGALVIISNASGNGIRDLYRQGRVAKLIRPKGLGPKNNPKSQVEYLFILDPLELWDEWNKIEDIKMHKI